MGRQTKHNHIVTPEKINLVCQENKDLLDEFIMYLETTGKKEGTILGYRNDIEIFYCWNLEKNKNKPFVEIGKREFMFYQNFCVKQLGLSSTRYRRMRSALSSMANYIENLLDDVYPNFKNYVNRVEAPPKSEVREKTIFEPEELQKLLDHLVETRQYQRACCVALGMASGNRKSELLRFRMDHFVDDNIVLGCWWKTHDKLSIKGRGDHKAHRYVRISQFKPYLDLWIEERCRLGIECNDLFVRKDGDTWVGVTTSALDGWAEKFTSILGKHFYWHSLRHFFTTQLSKEGLPADVIKDIIFWSSLDMVQLYNDEDADDKMSRYFNEDGTVKTKKASLGDL